MEDKRRLWGQRRKGEKSKEGKVEQRIIGKIENRNGGIMGWRKIRIGRKKKIGMAGGISASEEKREVR